MSTAADVATRLMEAFNDSDWDTFRELSHEDIVYVEAGTGRRLAGIDDYLEGLHGWKVALPDVRGTVRRRVDDGELVAIDVLWEGTHAGPLPTPSGTIPPTGRPVSVSATLWTTVRDGRVAEVGHHLDVLALLSQIGALE